MTICIYLSLYVIYKELSKICFANFTWKDMNMIYIFDRKTPV